jgi:hypothetical protein
MINPKSGRFWGCVWRAFGVGLVVVGPEHFAQEVRRLPIPLRRRLRGVGKSQPRVRVTESGLSGLPVDHLANDWRGVQSSKVRTLRSGSPIFRQAGFQTG